MITSVKQRIVKKEVFVRDVWIHCVYHYSMHAQCALMHSELHLCPCMSFCILSLRPKVIVTDVNLRGKKRHRSRGPCPGRTNGTKAQSGTALWDCDNYNREPSPGFRGQVSWPLYSSRKCAVCVLSHLW